MKTIWALAGAALVGGVAVASAEVMTGAIELRGGDHGGDHGGGHRQPCPDGADVRGKGGCAP